MALLPQHVEQDRLGDRLLGFRQVLPQRLVHHRLVAGARLLGACPKGVEHCIVDKDRDARLALLRNGRASLALREIVLSLHRRPSLRRAESACTMIYTTYV